MSSTTQEIEGRRKLWRIHYNTGTSLSSQVVAPIDDSSNLLRPRGRKSARILYSFAHPR